MKPLKIFGTTALLFLLMFLNACEDTVGPPFDPGTTFGLDPLKLTYTANPVLLEQTPDILYVFEISGEAEDYNLGKTTFESILQINSDSNHSWKQTGSMTLTDSEGDRLMGSFTGIADPSSETAVPISGTGEFSISHGTGKFKTSTGFGTYTFILNKEDHSIFKFSGSLTSRF